MTFPFPADVSSSIFLKEGYQVARQWEDELVELCRGMIQRQSLSG